MNKTEFIEQANELIDFGNSHEKSEGRGMMRVLDQLDRYNHIEYLRPNVTLEFYDSFVVLNYKNITFEVYGNLSNYLNDSEPLHTFNTETELENFILEQENEEN